MNHHPSFGPNSGGSSNGGVGNGNLGNGNLSGAPSRNTADVEAIKAELVKIESLIATALRLLDEGRVVELSALQERTKRVCDSAIRLPRSDSAPLIPAMEALLSALDALTANLSRRFGDIPTLTSLVGADAATSAYGQTLKHFP